MSTPCYLCSSDVYEAEKKVFDGKTFHGVCFGKWKKSFDKELADIRNAEYYKVPDVSTTKIRESNYNTIIYATQYHIHYFSLIQFIKYFDSFILAQGTQPNEAHLLEMLSSARKSNTSPSPTWAPSSSSSPTWAPGSSFFNPSRLTPSPTPPSLSASAPETSSSVTVVTPSNSNTPTHSPPRTWRPRSQSVNSSSNPSIKPTPEHATISAIPLSGSSKERSPGASPPISKRATPNPPRPMSSPPPSSSSSISKSPKSPPRASWPRRGVPSPPTDAPPSPLPTIIETPSSPLNVSSSTQFKSTTKRNKQRCTSLPPIRRNTSPFCTAAPPPSTIVPSIPPLQHILGDHRFSQNHSKPFERQYATNANASTPHPTPSPRSRLASVPITSLSPPTEATPKISPPSTSFSALEGPVKGKKDGEARDETEEDEITASELSSLLTNIVHFIKPSELPFSPTASLEGHGINIVKPSPLSYVTTFSQTDNNNETQNEFQPSSTSFMPYSPSKKNSPRRDDAGVPDSTSLPIAPPSDSLQSIIHPTITPSPFDSTSYLSSSPQGNDFIPINDNEVHNKLPGQLYSSIDQFSLEPQQHVVENTGEDKGEQVKKSESEEHMNGIERRVVGEEKDQEKGSNNAVGDDIKETKKVNEIENYQSGKIEETNKTLKGEQIDKQSTKEDEKIEEPPKEEKKNTETAGTVPHLHGYPLNNDKENYHNLFRVENENFGFKNSLTSSDTTARVLECVSPPIDV